MRGGLPWIHHWNTISLMSLSTLHGRFTPCRGIQILESGKFLLVESRILCFGIQNTSQGIWNPTNDWNPESKFHWIRLESSNWNLESGIHIVQSRIQDCLGLPQMRCTGVKKGKKGGIRPCAENTIFSLFLFPLPNSGKTLRSKQWYKPWALIQALWRREIQQSWGTLGRILLRLQLHLLNLWSKMIYIADT